MSEFTPGPWRWGWNGDACVVWGVAIVMSGGDYYPDSAARKAKEANARLIAAAPELYEALLSLEQAYANKHSPQHREACLAQARAALAKVRKP